MLNAPSATQTQTESQWGSQRLEISPYTIGLPDRYGRHWTYVFKYTENIFQVRPHTKQQSKSPYPQIDFKVCFWLKGS